MKSLWRFHRTLYLDLWVVSLWEVNGITSNEKGRWVKLREG